MDYTLVLLISVFHVLSVGTGAPLEGAPLEEEQIKQKVEEYANLLIVRLSHNFQVLFGALFMQIQCIMNKQTYKRIFFDYHFVVDVFQTPPIQTLRPSITELGGLFSIVAVLEGYNNLISDSLENVTQIKTEISILTEYIHQWSLEHCKELQTKSPEPEALKSLQKLKRFIHTVGIEALMRVKEYLELLRNNLDHLEIC
ncbi:LOW QUALITY PROTEIN: leptin-like [Austrofundulus limnaeus]|uniref:LOW QUALITY PROTEIN: leptin-like n=1 Tax=Austrofundulus limnaeus TaxID=52670 RepID=A0A2I4DAK8_AUSLI|nr:PREDICTED: LOW QUALITY PROTEIN: leptin-like [Austrofundulus limnaeus]